MTNASHAAESVRLPDPDKVKGMALNSTLQKRRSIRSYSTKPLSLEDLSQVLWSAQGITHPQGLRTAPSAGALYPMEIYVAAGNLEDLNPGVYHYNPQNHTLNPVRDSDVRTLLSRAALGQDAIQQAAAIIIIAAKFERTEQKYGLRAERYVHMEVGHIAQNIYLQAVSLQLGTVIIGAYSDREVKKVLRLPEGIQPLALMPVGYPP